MTAGRIKGLLGLCVRAGQAVFGADAIQKSIREGSCAALLLDGGISPNSEAKYRGLCGRTGVPIIRLPEGLLEEATGKPGAAMAVRRGSFSEAILSSAGEA